MEASILYIIQKYGYVGIFLLITIENIFPPIPSEVILLFSGFASSILNLNKYIIILVSTLGSIAGAFILYYIGRILNKTRLKLLVKGRVGKVIKLTENDIDKADKWFEKKGNKAVLICRFIPIVRSLISIPAGMNKMNIIKFSLYTFLGTFIWNTVLVIAGNEVGQNWITIANIMNKYSNIILIILMVLFISLSIFFYYKRSKKN